MEVRGSLSVFRGVIFFGLALLFLGCSGVSKQHEARETDVYHEKRIHCEESKYTDESANITQCVRSGPEDADK